MVDKLYYVCKYTPLELLESYGFEVERLEPALDAADSGESLAHPNLCGYGKAILQAVEEGAITRLFLMDCCDVCRRVYDVLAVKKDLDFLYFMGLPHKNGPLARRQMKKELLWLDDFLQQRTGRALDEAKARELWRQGILQIRAERPTEEHLVLTGAHGNAGLQGQIERVTGLPVWDDTCNGNRELAEESGEEFFADYGAALLSQPSPCMRMQFKRPEDPQGMGTICHTIKFCDYYGFQYRHLRDGDKPLLKIETDCTTQSQGQIETRLEAFAEVIDPRKIKRAGTGWIRADAGPLKRR